MRGASCVLAGIVLAFRIVPAAPARPGGVAALPLPFREAFAGPALDPAWTPDVSEGNAIAIRGGALEIRARAHTFAHIGRPLGIDLVRASCAIRAAPAISWAPSIFLYWGPGDWCQVGVIDRGDGGSFYAAEMVEGHPSEHDLEACDRTRWQWVGMELAEDGIRYLSSGDGRQWRLLRIARRPARFRGPPARLIAGKGYGRGDAAYPRPDLDNDYGDRGPFGTSRIREIVVRPLDPWRHRMTDEDRRLIEAAGRDTLGERVLAAGEPSFEAVAGLFPPLRHPREVAGVKDHPHDIGIAEDGTIEFSDDRGAADAPVAFFEVEGARFGSGPVGCTKRLLDGHLPIVVATWRRDGLLCEQTVLGRSEGMRPDRPLSACVRLRVTNTGDAARTARVRFRILHGLEPAEPLAWSLRLDPGGSRGIHIEIPFETRRRPAREIDAPAFGRALAETEGFWRAKLAAGMRIDVPERRVRDAFRAWLAYGFLDVDLRGTVYEPHDGAGFYEQVYGYSAALFCHALDLAGFHEDAARYLESLLAFQADDGSFIVNFGLPDTGALLLALAEHDRLTGDAAWLRRVAPRMEAMCRWIVESRRRSMHMVVGKRPVTYGLIECRPYCDHPQPAFDYFGDAYACVGLEETARVFAGIGRAEAAARLRDEAAAYRRDIIASMDAAAIERDGLAILPMEPATHRILKSTGYRAGGYYGLVASMMLESGLLDPRDPRALGIARFLRRRGGLILGLCEFAKGVDHAYTYGYLRLCLERGEIDRVLLGFYAALAYGMARGTYAGVEVTRIRTGENTPTLPHLYSSTQQIRLLRMMLLREEGDRLLIGHGIPRAWLAPGRRVAVQRAPTAFGPVSFAIEARAGGDRIGARIDPPGRCPPRAIEIALRHPKALAIGAATVRGAEAWTLRGEVIELRGVRAPLTIEARYGVPRAGSPSASDRSSGPCSSRSPGGPRRR